jgi:segregation and condensation protein A
METVTLDLEKFAIKTAVFEGPLELLIELVEKRKLLINDISLAAVTDEYMQRVSLMQELSLPNTVQFVTLAATLLLIKSKSLLPVLELTEEEEGSIEDLTERLRQYQVYRDAAAPINVMFGHAMVYEAQYTPPREPLFVTDGYCEQSALTEAMSRVLHNLPRETVPKARATVRPTISLEEMMTNLKNRIDRQLRTRFSDLRRDEPDHKNVIVGFLAILELFKQGNILVIQDGRFTDIHLESEKSGTPMYY